MPTPKSYQFFLALSIASVCLLAVCQHARADGEYVQIQSISQTGAVSPGTSVTFVASASGFTDPKYVVSDSFSASGSTVGTIDNVGFFTWTPGIYDAGRHTLTVTVTDAYNHSASTTASILVSGTTVLLTSISPGPIVAVGRGVSFSIITPGFISPNYAVYDSYGQSASTLNNGDVSSSGNFTWTPLATDVGVHTLTIAASDAVGHSGQTVTTITVINPSVSIRSLKSSGATVGLPVTFTASAMSLATTSYSVSDFSYGTSTVASSDINSSGTFSWTPTADDVGMHTLTVTATDTYGNSASTTNMIYVYGAPIAAAAQVLAPTQGAAATTTGTSSFHQTIATKNNYVFTASLGIGSHGTAVLQLQNRLAALGFFTGSPTGYYGQVTASGVKKFQAAHGLPKVGVVGPATRAALNK